MVINATRSKRGYRVGPRSRGAASGLGCTPSEYMAKNGKPKVRSQQQLMTHRPKAQVTFTNVRGHRVVSVKRQPEVLQLTKARR